MKTYRSAQSAVNALNRIESRYQSLSRRLHRIACNSHAADRERIAELSAALADMLALVDELTAYYVGDVASDPQSDAYAQRVKARAALAKEGGMSKPTKYEAKNQPGLLFWAEPNGGGAGAIESYGVVSQANGYPVTEAHDDWFAYFKDADAIAKQLAETNPGITQ